MPAPTLPGRQQILKDYTAWRAYYTNLRSMIEQCDMEHERQFWISTMRNLFVAHVAAERAGVTFQAKHVQGDSQLRDGVRIGHNWHYTDGDIHMASRGQPMTTESGKQTSYFTAEHVSIANRVVHYNEPQL